MEHQDLKVVYLRKSPKELEKSKRMNGETSVAKNSHHQHAKKILDDHPDSYKVDTVSHTLKTQIQKARMAQKLTQKQLAQKINVTPSVIQSYENGKAVPDNKVLQNLRRVLKVKLVRR